MNLNFKNILAGIGGLSVFLLLISVSIFSFADYYVNDESVVVSSSPNIDCVPEVPKKFSYKGEISLDKESIWYSTQKSLKVEDLNFNIVGNTVVIIFANKTEQIINFKTPIGLAYDVSIKSLWITDEEENKIINYRAICEKYDLTIKKEVMSFDVVKGKNLDWITDPFIFDFKLDDFKFSLSDGGTLPQTKVFSISDEKDYSITEVLNKFVDVNKSDKQINQFLNGEIDTKFQASFIDCKDTAGKVVAHLDSFLHQSSTLILKSTAINDDIICTIHNTSLCTWFPTSSIIFPKNDKQTAPTFYDGIGFSLNGFGFFGIGFDSLKGDFSNRWFKFIPGRYDYANNQYGGTWQEVKPFPGVARRDALGFVLNGKGYVAFGADRNNKKLKDVWEYNSESDSWTQKNDFPFTTGGMSDASVFTMNNEAYVIGGKGDGGKSSNNTFVYESVDDNWDKIASFPGEARNSAIAFSIGERAYFGTGKNNSNQDLADFWEYYQGKWTRKIDFSGGPTSGAYSFSIEDKGYLGGGSGRGNRLDGFWQFNPSGNNGHGSWEQMKERTESYMPGNPAVAFVINGKAYVEFPNGSSNGFMAYRPCP